MRIASLLPSATEIVCALGAREDLVGISHECDYPPDVEGLPVFTRARMGPIATSKGIDAAVRDIVRDALGVYEINIERLRDARPDVIVTQDLCDVCAVSLDDVQAAVTRLARHDVKIVSLRPTRLDGIWADIEATAESIGRLDSARKLVANLQARVASIAERAARLPGRPTVLSIEWIDPVMIGGMWMPELVALAGGEPLVTRPGDHAPTLGKEELRLLDPDVVLIKPCGFDLPRTLREVALLPEVLPRWRALDEGRVHVADGNAYFNRPGPRIVESLEILAACVHPEAFADFAEKHRASVVRLGRDLSVRPIVEP